MLHQRKGPGHSFAWKASGVPILNGFLEKQPCPRCHIVRCVVLGWIPSNWSNPQHIDENADRMRKGRPQALALQSAGRDAIHERRKSTTEVTFAPSWRADYILYSNAMTQATCSGGKIGWGKLFKTELNGIMRNRYVPMWCMQCPSGPSGGYYAICLFFVFSVSIPPCVLCILVSV